MAQELIGPATAKATEETAKTAGKALDLTEKFGSFLGKVFGTVPEDVIGLLGGDLLHELRLRNLAKLEARTEEILKIRGVDNTAPVSPSLAIPLLEAAKDESREELQEIWAKLLATARDPKRQSSVRQSFIEIVKEMDPTDVIVLQAIFENGVAQWMPNGRDFVKTKLQISENEVLVSFENLEKLGCVNFHITDAPKINPILSPRGNLLMNALRP